MFNYKAQLEQDRIRAAKLTTELAALRDIKDMLGDYKQRKLKEVVMNMIQEHESKLGL